MLRDNPEGSSSRWLSSAGGPSPALHFDGRKSSEDRPSCLENPRPAGAESTLTENVASPFPAEPRPFCVGANGATLALEVVRLRMFGLGFLVTASLILAETLFSLRRQ